MGQLAVAVFVMAALLSIIYGRRVGSKFLDAVFTALGAFILFVVAVGVSLYIQEQRNPSKPFSARPPAAIASPSTPPTTPPSQPAYQPQIHTCNVCSGLGNVPCTYCQGTGYTYQSRQNTEGMPPPPDCPKCGLTTLGGGGMGRARCWRCEGTGQVVY